MIFIKEYLLWSIALNIPIMIFIKMVDGKFPPRTWYIFNVMVFLIISGIHILNIWS